MITATPQKIRVKFEAGGARNSFSLPKKSNGAYVLPDGREAYFSPDVMKRIAGEFSCINCTESALAEILALIDAGGSETKLVPVQKIGKGPTEKSARFKVAVTQSTHDEGGNPIKKTKMTEFTLPVSQIEDAGDGQLAAPLWLILEKLEYKKNSGYGQKHRASENVTGEFVPATLLSSKPSPRVTALKEWISTQIAVTARESERATKEREAKQKNMDDATQKTFEALMKTNPETPTINGVVMLPISLITPHIPAWAESPSEIIHAVRKLWAEHMRQTRPVKGAEE